MAVVSTQDGESNDGNVSLHAQQEKDFFGGPSGGRKTNCLEAQSAVGVTKHVDKGECSALV